MKVTKKMGRKQSSLGQRQLGSAAEGQDVAPAEGQDVAPAEGQNVAPAEGQNVAPAEGQNVAPESRLTVGVDVGDRNSHVCELDGDGEIVARKRIRTTPKAVKREYGGRPALTVALEAGTHSRWMSRLLEELGHTVIVANPRRLRVIYENDRKRDELDAEMLARLARVDPALLYGIKHRGEQAQLDLQRLRTRDLLVRTRTGYINHIRSAVKSLSGERLPSCDAGAFAKRMSKAIPAPLRPFVRPLLKQVGEVTRAIRALERELERIAHERYPVTELLRTVPGVGPITALAFVLTLEDPGRFRDRRSVGPFVGLVPKLDDSGKRQSQLGISKAGDPFVRRLLVQAAHYILGPFGKDSDLQRFGRKLAQRGGKKARKRAVIAVARKLAVILLALWQRETVYVPLRSAEDAA